MKKHHLITLMAASLACMFAQAAPDTIEIDEATIIVMRPLDQWSGDRSALQDSLEAHQEKTVWYLFQLPNQGFIYGNPNWTQSATKHPVVQLAASMISAEGFKLPRSSKNSFSMQPPVSVPPETVNDILKIQEFAFRRTTLANGDPDKLQGKTSRNKFFGGVLALGVTVLAADKLGVSLGAHATLGSGITEGLYNLASQYKGGLVPVTVGAIDAGKYTIVDLRRVTTNSPERLGQVLIAYKVPKTEQAEITAMAHAIVALSGAKSTTEQIQAARAEDLKNRQSIWAECKAQDLPECKD